MTSPFSPPSAPPTMRSRKEIASVPSTLFLINRPSRPKMTFTIKIINSPTKILTTVKTIANLEIRAIIS